MQRPAAVKAEELDFLDRQLAKTLGLWKSRAGTGSDRVRVSAVPSFDRGTCRALICSLLFKGVPLEKQLQQDSTGAFSPTTGGLGPS